MENAPYPACHWKWARSAPLVLSHFEDRFFTSSTTSARVRVRARENSQWTWSAVPLPVRLGESQARKTVAMYGYSSTSMSGVISGWRCLVLKTRWMRTEASDWGTGDLPGPQIQTEIAPSHVRGSARSIWSTEGAQCNSLIPGRCPGLLLSQGVALGK